MQEHPLLGARILESIRFLRGVVPIVRTLRALDGTGYPDALVADQIPLAARILAVAIAFESMLAERPYRPARREDQALAEIKGFAGTYYDPTVVNAFISMVEARGIIHAAEEDVASTSRELSILSELTPEFHTILDLQQLLDRTLVVLLRAVPGARSRSSSTTSSPTSSCRGPSRARGPRSTRPRAWRATAASRLGLHAPSGPDRRRRARRPRYIGDRGPERAHRAARLARQAVGVLVLSHPAVPLQQA